MRPAFGRWLYALGAVTAVAGWVLGQSAAADASPAAPAGPARAAAAATYVPQPGTLHPGDHGPEVKLLQQRLAQLHYYPGPVNSSFGQATLEAVWAFKEVQGLQLKVSPNDVGAVMQRHLVSPHAPKVLIRGGPKQRIEVYLPKGYLVLYNKGKIELISHVSAGGGYYYPCSIGSCRAITPDGNYHALSFIAGWVTAPLGKLYNPVFFIGTKFAIHGDIPVPLKAASHGCVRIPMDIATWFHTRIHIPGTPIYIRGRVPGT